MMAYMNISIVVLHLLVGSLTSIEFIASVRCCIFFTTIIIKINNLFYLTLAKSPVIIPIRLIAANE